MAKTNVYGVGIQGPGLTTDNAVLRWDGINGTNVQDSGVTIDDSNNVIIPGDLIVANLLVEDSLITLNDGGTTGGGTLISSTRAVGLEFEEDAAITGYIRTGLGTDITASDETELKFKATGGSILTVDMDANGELEYSAAKKLTISETCIIDQDLQQSSDVIFATLTATELATVTGLLTANGSLDVNNAGLLHCNGNYPGTNAILLTSLSASAFGANLGFNHLSASPSIGDTIGNITFKGNNDAAQNVNYAQIRCKIIDESDGTEDGGFSFFTSVGGSLTEVLSIVADNVGIGTTTFGTSASKVLGIQIGTEPTTSPGNMIQMYSKDSSDGGANATLGLRTEQTVETTAAFTQTDRLKIWINGVEYYISLDAV